MHDPMTVAHEIKSPFKDKYGYRKSLITIWHVDPEKDGTDDSCGWFKRARHGDEKVFKEIKKEFEFNFKHNYWFNEAGYPKLSTIGIVVNMYKCAAWIVFKKNKGRKKSELFMKKHIHEIISFAENPFDSLDSSINMRYGVEKQEYRIEHFASIIYGDVLRKIQPWYKHPRWHLHHWKIQFNFWQEWFRKRPQAINADRKNKLA